MFPLILIHLENGLNEFYFANKNGNISPGAVAEVNLINLAAVEKTKQKNIISPLFYVTPVLYWNESEGNTTRGPMVL